MKETWLKLRNTINFLFWIIVFCAALFGKIETIGVGIQFAISRIFCDNELSIDISRNELLWACIGSAYIDIGLLIRFLYPYPEDGKYKAKFRYRKRFRPCSCYTRRLPRKEQWICCCVCHKEIKLDDEFFYNPSNTEALCYKCHIKDEDFSKQIRINPNEE